MKVLGLGFEEVDAGRSCWSAHGEVLAAAAAAYRVPDHTEIMAARPDVGAVVTRIRRRLTRSRRWTRPAALRPRGITVLLSGNPAVHATGGLIKNRSLGAGARPRPSATPSRACCRSTASSRRREHAAAIMTAVAARRPCRTQLTAMAAGRCDAGATRRTPWPSAPTLWSARQLLAVVRYLLRRAWLAHSGGCGLARSKRPQGPHARNSVEVVLLPPRLAWRESPT